MEPIDNENDPGLLEKLQQAKEKDQKEEEEVKKILEPLEAKNDFMKVMEYNNPKILIVIGVISAATFGFSQPFFGVVFSKV